MLVTVQNLRDWFSVDAKDSKLNFCIEAASDQVREWVGDTVYEDAGNAARVRKLTRAEANLAVYHLLLNTGARVRPSGVAKKEQDSGGSVTNNVTNEYLTPEELSELRAEYLAAAEKIAEPFRLPPTGAVIRPKAGTLTLTGGWRGSGIYDES